MVLLRFSVEAVVKAAQCDSQSLSGIVGGSHGEHEGALNLELSYLLLVGVCSLFISIPELLAGLIVQDVLQELVIVVSVCVCLAREVLDPPGAQGAHCIIFELLVQGGLVLPELGESSPQLCSGEVEIHRCVFLSICHSCSWMREGKIIVKVELNLNMKEIISNC